MYICQVYLNDTMETTLVGIFSTPAKAMSAGADFIHKNMEEAELIDWDHNSIHGTFTDWYMGLNGSNATRIITGVRLDTPLA
jgi:hypothetical protein